MSRNLHLFQARDAWKAREVRGAWKKSPVRGVTRGPSLDSEEKLEGMVESRVEAMERKATMEELNKLEAMEVTAIM